MPALLSGLRKVGKAVLDVNAADAVSVPPDERRRVDAGPPQVGGDAACRHDRRTGCPVRADSYTPVMPPIDCRLVSRSTRSFSAPSRAPRKFRYCNRCASDNWPGLLLAVAPAAAPVVACVVPISFSSGSA